MNQNLKKIIFRLTIAFFLLSINIVIAQNSDSIISKNSESLRDFIARVGYSSKTYDNEYDNLSERVIECFGENGYLVFSFFSYDLKHFPMYYNSLIHPVRDADYYYQTTIKDFKYDCYDLAIYSTYGNRKTVEYYDFYMDGKLIREIRATFINDGKSFIGWHDKIYE